MRARARPPKTPSGPTGGLRPGRLGVVLVFAVVFAGLAAAGARCHAGKGAAAAAKPAPVFVVAPFSAPAGLPGLGTELARGLVAALRDAGIEAQPGSAAAERDPSLEGRIVTGRIEQLAGTSVRLHATFRGASVQSIGDLEHLDDLVFAVFSQLRPRITLASGPPGTGPGPGGPASVPEPDPGPAPPPPATPAEKTAPPPTQKERELAKNPGGTGKRPGREPGITLASVTPPGSRPPAPTPAKTLPGPTPAPSPSKTKTEPTPTPTPTPAKPTRTETAPPDAGTPPGPAPAPPAPPAPATNPSAPATPAAPAPGPPPAPAPAARPRLAVNVVGEPVSPPPPPGFYGLGSYAQQALMTYAQHRLRVVPVASRLVGLVGGLDALGQSLRLGARHTLMARLDQLTLTGANGSHYYSGYSGSSLSGRIHVVLLLDGKLLLDRSVALAPTTLQPGEPPASVLARAVTGALETLTSELVRHLGAAP